MAFSTIAIKNLIEENKKLGFSPVIRTIDGQTFSEERTFYWEPGFPSIKEKNYYRKRYLKFDYNHIKGLVKIEVIIWYKHKEEHLLSVSYIPEQNITSITFAIPKEEQTRGVE